jgi:hypothetical protein
MAVKYTGIEMKEKAYACEEIALVKKGVDDLMGKIESGEIKTKPYSDVRKKYSLK